MSKLRLMSNNIWCCGDNAPGWAEKGEDCSAEHRAKEDGKLLIFATTHLWWKTSDKAECWRGDYDYQEFSDEAREYQLNMLINRVEELRAKYNCPAVIVGDFNAVYDSLAVQSALSRGWVHGHDVATEYRDEKNGHHFCYAEGYDHYENPKSFKESIDQFIIKGAQDGFVKRFDRFYEDYYMCLYDHFPMWCDVEL